MSCYYAELNNEALLHITGPDTLKFLQGQATCDTNEVNAEHALPGAYCTPKGRVVCDFLLCQITENHFALRLRRDIVDVSATTFGKYIIFSKAELEKDNSDWRLFGCWGTQAQSTLISALGLVADTNQIYDSYCGEGYVIIQADEAGTRFECYINERTHPQLIQKMTSAMSVSTENSWRVGQIEQGIARIEAATVEEFIPQALNYDLTGHVSFNKGCYTGQEVVARMHYRGKPKKRLFHATFTEAYGEPVAACTPLYAPESSQSTGTVVNTATNNDGQTLCLIVAPVAGTVSPLHLSDRNGPSLSYDSTVFSNPEMSLKEGCIKP